ncbi:Retrovirus-related Pol polyprotein from transposon 17.6 [Gossypium australe]|uniref:Retrovirus-related Pol polyprotein from transposon 17.6 n=1 Tax=Gossypium australe TaxID=47621 RepID=A0A5B6VXG2_9ROSI|nr:Retrovirus-related Pol polyprotein from transposon 17.6 [Gossypium australe]
MQALLREMERLLDRRLNPLEDWLYQVENQGPRDHESNLSVGKREPRNRGQRERRRDDDGLKNIKLSIPDAYIEWEKKIKLVFDCHNYSENKKVKFAAIEFSDYAMIWWDQLTTSRRRNGECSITTWAEMKAAM